MATIVQKVAVINARFFSPIGFYEEEQELGNEFFVDVSVSFPFVNPNSEVLNNTLNYEALYQILVDVMTPRRKLLESAAEDILNRVTDRFAFVKEVTVLIRKTNPAFGGDVAQSEVSLHYQK